MLYGMHAEGKYAAATAIIYYNDGMIKTKKKKIQISFRLGLPNLYVV